MKDNYTVTDVCLKAGVTRKTLFYYDKIGLLKPTIRLGAQGRKLYDPDQLLRLYRIQKYQNAGLTINEIKLVVDVTDEESKLQLLHTVYNRLINEQHEKAVQIELLKKLIEELNSKITETS